MGSGSGNVATDRKTAPRNAAAHVAKMAHALAEIAARQDLDLLEFILRIAALEAENVLDAGSTGPEINLERLSSDSRERSEERTVELATTNIFAEKLEQANQDLEKAAKLAEEAVEERRRTLHEIDRLERSIQRAQVHNSRLLDCLIRAA
jgi:hypothetical protein